MDDPSNQQNSENHNFLAENPYQIINDYKL